MLGRKRRDLKGNISDYCKEHNLDKSLFCSILRQLDFEREQFLKNTENYSEGQKKESTFGYQFTYTGAHIYLGRTTKLHRYFFADAVGKTNFRISTNHVLC